MGSSRAIGQTSRGRTRTSNQPTPTRATRGTPGYPASAVPASPGYGYGYPAPGPVRQTNGLAIASMVVSLASIVICGFPAIVGAIMGHVARKQIRERGEDGDGMALTGVIVGWIVFALSVIGTWRLSSSLVLARSNRQRLRAEPVLTLTGGRSVVVRVRPAARPFAAITSAILRDASSIISSPSITAPSLPPASEV